MHGSQQLIFLQEHFLFCYDKKELSEIFPSYENDVKCIDDKDPIPPLFRPRGQAGTACLWSSDMSSYVEILPDGSDRVQVIRLNFDQPIVIINTYMPAEGTHSNATYSGTLDEVHEILEKYGQTHQILWLGDINADPQRRVQRSNDRKFQQFCLQNQLSVSKHHPLTATYKRNEGQSCIDLLLQPVNQENLITSIKVDDENPINHSPHSAVIANIVVQIANKQKPKSVQNLRTCLPKVNWEKCDVAKYKELTHEKLTTLYNMTSDQTPPEVLISRMNNILSQASSETCPPAKPRRDPTKYRWHRELKPLAEEAKSTFARWKEAGRIKQDAYYKIKQAAKLALRNAQQQILARERNEKQHEIMKASENNMKLFHKLINQQRKTSKRKPLVQFVDDLGIPALSWGKYFHKLATPVNYNTFDPEYERHINFKHLLLSLTTHSGDIQPTTEEDIGKHISSLANNKAADPFNITAEHLKLAAPIIGPLITRLTNSVFRKLVVPDEMKVGNITPCPKKAKSQCKPDNFRRITVNSIIGKIIDKVTLPKLNQATLQFENQYQFGFTEKVASTTASVLVTELIAEANDTRCPLYMIYMDASKAFDLVHHKGMMNIIHDHGCDGKLWEMLNESYNGITSQVKWDGLISEPFEETQGIRQGGLLSAKFFKDRCVPILSRVSHHQDSFSIGHIKCGSIMVADDLLLASQSKRGIQNLVNEAELDASHERYLFSESKTKVQEINTKYSSKIPTLENIQLNGKPLKVSNEETHLGVNRRADQKHSSTIESRIQSANRMLLALMGAGLHGLNGLSPTVSLKLLKIYVVPCLLYGLETICLSQPNINALETFYRATLKRIQHLPESSANAACYLLLGVLPIQAQIDVKILTLFGSILRREGSLEREVAERQLAVKDLHSPSWFSTVKKLLLKYDLPSYNFLLIVPPKKEKWKNIIRGAVAEVWMEELKSEASEMSSLRFLNLEVCQYGQVHPAWNLSRSNPLTSFAANVRVKLLVQRYPLSSNHTAGSHMSKTCKMCHQEEETTLHFLLHCAALRETRSTHLPPVMNFLRFYKINVTPDEVTRFIVDPSRVTMSDEDHISIEHHIRTLCYKLHQDRSDKLSIR